MERTFNTMSICACVVELVYIHLCIVAYDIPMIIYVYSLVAILHLQVGAYLYIQKYICIFT